MSEIKEGDLVRIVKSHTCDPERGLGYITTVERIDIAHAFECRRCGMVDHSLDGQQLAFGTVSLGSGYWPLAWLRRIPPLDELEGEKHDEEITA